MHRLITLVLTAAMLLFVPSAAFAAPADVDGALAYAPKDSFAVVTANLESIKKSKVFNIGKNMFLAEEKNAKKELAKLKAKTGFDVWRDVHAAAIVFGKNFAKDDNEFAVIAHVSMKEKKIIAFAKAQGAKMELKQGPQGPYYLLGKRKEGALAFRGKFVVLSGAKFMPKVLQKQGLSPKLKGLMAKYKSRDLAAAIDVIPSVSKELAKEDKMFKDLRSAAAGLNVKVGAQLDAEAKFSNSKTPKKIAQVANQGLTELKKDKNTQKMGLGRFLSKVAVSAVGPTLKGSVKLNQADVDKLEKLLRNLL